MLGLPNAALAIVEADKVGGYLLSPSHPVGRFKAIVFKALGYSQDAWPVLQADLLALAGDGAVLGSSTSPYGMKYEVDGRLVGPDGRSARIKTIWFIKHGDAAPRLVTAYPE